MFNNKKKADENEAEEVKNSAEPAQTEETAKEATAEGTAAEQKAEKAESAENADLPALQKTLADTKAELETIKAELAKITDLRLRLAAEYDNFRKRSQREKEALYADVTASSVATLLPIIDNVERALAAENASAEDMRKGVEMINTQAVQALEKLGVSAFGAVGDAFDPNIHHCVGTTDAEGIESGAIAVVLQKGYKLGDKVIRPAMVQTAN
ncbi:MAG: nucleotide exchange factor GrpE [Acutalibacteraceae bacterium]|nr:nucleotide exchange factor GrpE [Bacillota bacterium]